MSELRWDSLWCERVATVTHRMVRPQIPRDWCPFCPVSGWVPDRHDVYLYPNDISIFTTPVPDQSVTVVLDAGRKIRIRQDVGQEIDSGRQLACKADKP